MGIWYTNKPIYDRWASAESRDEVFAGFDAGLQAAGWDRSTITGGYRYRATSPQVFGGRPNFHVTADLDLLFESADYLTVQFQPGGLKHRLAWESGRTYWYWINCCQFHIAVPYLAGMCWDRSDPHPHNTVSGGIPYLYEGGYRGDLTETTDEITAQCWWSWGDSGDGPSATGAQTVYGSACNPRKDTYRWDYPWYGCWSALYGDTVAGSHKNWAPYDGWNMRLPTPQSGEVVDDNAGRTDKGSNTRAIYRDLRPLYSEPMIAWGLGPPKWSPINPDINLNSPRVFGQLWDAMLVTSLPGGVDTIIDYTGSDIVDGLWRQFTGLDTDPILRATADAAGGMTGIFYGGVMLLTGVGAPASKPLHYAY